MERVIIIVDDEEEFVANLKYELHELRPEWQIRSFTSGLDALQLILQGGVDVVVTDIAMPDMDGYELFWRIRDHDINLPVIMMTGFGYVGTRLVRSKKDGSNRRNKPIPTEELVQARTEAHTGEYHSGIIKTLRHEQAEQLVSIHLLQRSLLCYLLYPLSLVWLLVQRHRRRQPGPRPLSIKAKILSIGNIVSGGSGKTPTTIALAKILKDKGYKVAVSHRGYKGEYENQPILISSLNGLNPEAEKAGDEACLIASKLIGTPVVVGRDRKAAIICAKPVPDLDVIILDDSFQHLK